MLSWSFLFKIKKTTQIPSLSRLFIIFAQTKNGYDATNNDVINFRTISTSLHLKLNYLNFGSLAVIWLAVAQWKLSDTRWQALKMKM